MFKNGIGEIKFPASLDINLFIYLLYKYHATAISKVI